MRGADILTDVYPDTRTNPYPKARIASILHHRELLEKELFIDLLLTTVAAIPEAPRLYPPKTQSALRELLTALKEAPTLDSLKRDSVHYYLLLDYDLTSSTTTTSTTTSTTPHLPTHPHPTDPASHPHHPHSFPTPHADTFATAHLLPPNFISLMRGFHALDNFQFPLALSYLTQPSVHANGAEKILRTLAQHAGPDAAIAFVASSCMSLDSEAAQRTYFHAVLQTGCVQAAFLYVRGVGDAALREDMLRALVESCLDDHHDDDGGERDYEMEGVEGAHVAKGKGKGKGKATVGKEGGGGRRDRGQAELLVNLPFTPDEERVVEEVLRARGGVAEEARLLRWLHAGRLGEVVDGARSAGVSGDVLGGLGWEMLARGVEKGMGPRRAVEGS